ncbi:delta(14)-sterol reductase TM7SF2 [Sitophilus oryzae]|uniref:Delta(14)-sterol reductase TM7SF2 n=1 Tax=Sitophilus oryzae TaxID=7048 RepID=A0A6J2XP57_SITOR|nr:delta(14)-sterol reductase TM7SF2 [Sitophilus oryzae]XP_030752655.1 delta(14)-sterol reductase TM7SF2 [Sitophilus oryzae]
MVLTKRANAKLAAEKPSKDAPKKAEPERKSSPARTKSPARKPSPARTRSPGRPKTPEGGRARSPGRPKKNATEVKDRSPSRRKSELPVAKPVQRSGKVTPTRRSPIKRTVPKLDLSDDENKDDVPLIVRKPRVFEIETTLESDDDRGRRSLSRSKPKNDLVNKLQDNLKREISVESSTSSILKRVTRSQNREVDRIIHLKNFENFANKMSEFSDEEEKPKQQTQRAASKINFNFLGILGVLSLIISIPTFVFLLLTQCSKDSCTLKSSFSSFKSIPLVFLNFLPSFLGYSSYFALLILLSILPWGRKVSNLPDKQEKRNYRMNGLLSAALLISLTLILETQQISAIKFVLNNYIYLYLSALVVGISLSILAYVRSFYVSVSALNPNIVNKGRIYNFFVGRELHPRIWGLDWKLFVIRSAVLTKLLIDLALVYNKLHVHLNISEKAFNINLNHLTPTNIVFLALATIFTFDWLIFEYTRITSKEVQQEAFGYYMAVTYLTLPFINSFVTKYVLDHNIKLSYWELGLVTALFLLGYIIYRGSNNQKDAFRKNPYSPSFSNLETLPTTQGKKLLCSGFWGLVRHPNYLGHILIELSVIPFILNTPLLIFVFIKVLFLIYRTLRDSRHCKQRYGTAWDRYCNKVRYHLIPKIF